MDICVREFGWLRRREDLFLFLNLELKGCNVCFSLEEHRRFSALLHFLSQRNKKVDLFIYTQTDMKQFLTTVENIHNRVLSKLTKAEEEHRKPEAHG